MSPSPSPDVVIERALQTARELTGMELAFVGQFRHGRELIRNADGDAERFGLTLDDGPELEATYCQRMVDGRLPSAVPDTRAHPVAAALDVTEAAASAPTSACPCAATTARSTGPSAASRARRSASSAASTSGSWRCSRASSATSSSARRPSSPPGARARSCSRRSRTTCAHR